MKKEIWNILGQPCEFWIESQRHPSTDFQMIDLNLLVPYNFFFQKSIVIERDKAPDSFMLHNQILAYRGELYAQAYKRIKEDI
jgi:hypothetical protein